jgi:hypothetical protein
MVYRVFRFDRIEFFDNLRLTPEEIERVSSFGETTTESHRPAETVYSSRDIDSLCRILERNNIGGSASSSSRGIDFATVMRRPDPGEDCPVCYDELLKDGNESLILPSENGEGMRIVGLLGCPTCGKGIHEVCVQRWMRTSPHKTCVYCRSPVWQKYT